MQARYHRLFWILAISLNFMACHKKDKAKKEDKVTPAIEDAAKQDPADPTKTPTPSPTPPKPGGQPVVDPRKIDHPGWKGPPNVTGGGQQGGAAQPGGTTGQQPPKTGGSTTGGGQTGTQPGGNTGQGTQTSPGPGTGNSGNTGNTGTPVATQSDFQIRVEDERVLAAIDEDSGSVLMGNALVGVSKAEFYVERGQGMSCQTKNAGSLKKDEILKLKNKQKITSPKEEMKSTEKIVITYESEAVKDFTITCLYRFGSENSDIYESNFKGVLSFSDEKGNWKTASTTGGAPQGTNLQAKMATFKILQPEILKKVGPQPNSADQQELVQGKLVTVNEANELVVASGKEKMSCAVAEVKGEFLTNKVYKRGTSEVKETQGSGANEIKTRHLTYAADDKNTILFECIERVNSEAEIINAFKGVLEFGAK